MNRIGKMIAGIQQAKDGNYAVRLETSGQRDELDALTEAINHLLDHVQENHAAFAETKEALRESQERYREATDGERAEGQISQNLREMTLLHKISLLINSSLSLEEVMHAIMEGIHETLGPDLVIVFLKYMTACTSGSWSGFPLQACLVPVHQVGECLCGLAAQHGNRSTHLIFPLIHAVPGRSEEAGLRSFAALPLRGGTRSWASSA